MEFILFFLRNLGFSFSYIRNTYCLSKVLKMPIIFALILFIIFLCNHYFLLFNIYYILPFPILEKHPFFLPPFVGLCNLSVKQNQNYSLAQSVPPPWNKPHSSLWVWPDHSYLISLSLVPLAPCNVSSSAFFAPPFTPSTQFLYFLVTSFHTHISSSHELFSPPPPFYKYSEEVTYTLSTDTCFIEEFLFQDLTFERQVFVFFFFLLEVWIREY